MKNLIIILSLFASMFTFSQVNQEDFKGVWQADNNYENILIIYENKKFDRLNFYNYKLDEEFLITESFLFQEENTIKSNYQDHLTHTVYNNIYSLDRKKLVRSTNGMKQTFTKIN